MNRIDIQEDDIRTIATKVKNNRVYRQQRRNGETIHGFLQYLEEKGFYQVPRFLGIDEKNREILSYVPGTTFTEYPPLPVLGSEKQVICEIAALLRKYHDATLDYEIKKEDIWVLPYKGNLVKEVICHNDFAPYNVTFSGKHPVGIIDFDSATPGPRIWDIAYAMYRFIPLGREIFEPEKQEYRIYDPLRDADFRKEGIALFFQAYGMERPEDFFEQVTMRIEYLIDTMEEGIQAGNEAFIRMKEEGHIAFYQEEIKFIQKNALNWI